MFQSAPIKVTLINVQTTGETNNLSKGPLNQAVIISYFLWLSIVFPLHWLLSCRPSSSEQISFVLDRIRSMFSYSHPASGLIPSLFQPLINLMHQLAKTPAYLCCVFTTQVPIWKVFLSLYRPHYLVIQYSSDSCLKCFQRNTEDAEHVCES